MRVDQRLVVHLVDVIAGEHDHQPWGRHLQRIDVLVDGVGSAEIPVVIDPLLRREHVEELAEVAAEQPMPSQIQVAVEAPGLVLREHEQPPQTAVEAVREREIDDPVGATERHSGLRAVAGERVETCASAAGQHHGHHVSHAGQIDVSRTHRRACTGTRLGTP